MEQSLSVRQLGTDVRGSAAGDGPVRRGLDWETAAVLGGAWGGVEVTLGAFLHGLRIPASGFLLAWLQAAFLVAASRALRRRGVALGAGLVAGGIRLLLPAGALFGPAVAVAVQGAAVEAGLVVPGLLGAAAAGGLALSWTFLQAVIMGLVVYGADMATLYAFVLRRISQGLGLGGVGGSVAVVVGIVLLAGASAGLSGAWLAERAGGPSLDGMGRAGPVPGSLDARVPAGRRPAWWVWGPVGLATVALILGWKVAFLAGVGLSVSAAAVWDRRLALRLWAPRVWVTALLVAVGAALVSGLVRRAGWLGLGLAVAALIARVVHVTLIGLLAEAWARGGAAGPLRARLGRFGRAVTQAWRFLPEVTGWIGARGAAGRPGWRDVRRFGVAFLAFALARARGEGQAGGLREPAPGGMAEEVGVP